VVFGKCLGSLIIPDNESSNMKKTTKISIAFIAIVLLSYVYLLSLSIRPARFTIPDNIEDITQEELINNLVAERVRENLIPLLGNELNLIPKFTFNKYVKSFQKISVNDWQTKWIDHKNMLIEKAKENQLDHASLTKCLDQIALLNDEELALVPILACSCKSLFSDVWVIVCVWGQTTITSEGISSGDLSLGHVRVWAFRAKDQEVIGFNTCD